MEVKLVRRTPVGSWEMSRTIFENFSPMLREKSVIGRKQQPLSGGHGGTIDLIPDPNTVILHRELGRLPPLALATARPYLDQALTNFSDHLRRWS